VINERETWGPPSAIYSSAITNLRCSITLVAPAPPYPTNPADQSSQLKNIVVFKISD